MSLEKQAPKNENPRQSPKDVLANLKAYYNNEDILRSIEQHVDFANETAFFNSLKIFLNDFEDTRIIDMLFNSSIKGIAEEMDLYKRAEQGIIKTVDRPLFLINNNQIDIPITTSWTKHIEENWTKISKGIPAVGRIEITGHDRMPWAGTGWLLKNTDIIVTNRHVANHFASQTEKGVFQIKDSSRRRPLGVKIDFKKEHDTNVELQFDVKEVIHITKKTELDIALLRVETQNYNGHKLPEGLELSYDPPTLEEKIYVVGYPACNQNEDLKNNFFNGISGVKQFSPGTFFRTCVSDYIYKHDCTTWGGNSGSPLLDFKSGKVLGIHYAGTSEGYTGFRANYAVSVLYLIALLEELGEKYTYELHPEKE